MKKAAWGDFNPSHTEVRGADQHQGQAVSRPAVRGRGQDWSYSGLPPQNVDQRSTQEVSVDRADIINPPRGPPP